MYEWVSVIQKEALFIEKLKQIFVGAKIEGDSGFINLMIIKSRYFDTVFPLLMSRIDEVCKEFPEFREELFDKIYSFMKRYFSESGSIYFRYLPLRATVYEKIYSSSSDVSLFWKTHMLYYVKSDRLWASMSLKSEDSKKNPVSIYFDSSGILHKNANEKRRLTYELDKIENNTIIIRCQYSERNKKTDIQSMAKECGKLGIDIPFEKLNEAISVFEKQTEVDYFINKDARKFLKQQFDMWLKNYLLEDTAFFDATRINQLKSLKEVSYTLIDFVAQFEEELVKIWNKPKFVLNSQYVITINKILELENGNAIMNYLVNHKGFEQQLKEWIQIGFLSEDFTISSDDMIKIISINNPNNNRFYFFPIDTSHFDVELKTLIEKSIVGLDEHLDGWLIHSENYQALNTLLPKFKGKIQTIYIDPPFNLGENADFLYNVNYKDSTWITMLENRINLAHKMLNEKGNMFVRCDYNGNMYIRLLMNMIFGEDKFKNEIPINRINKQDPKAMKFNGATDSLFFYAKSEKSIFKPLQIKLESEKSARWHSMDSQGQGTASKIFGFPFEPPKGRHWTFSEQKIKELEAQKRIKIRCKSCGYEHLEGQWQGCPQCENKTEVRAYYLLDATDLKQIDSNWTDIPGYTHGHDFSTENSEILLKRVIECSSNPKDIIMDFFLGSGTTTAVAHKLGRKWIGIEIGEHFHSVVLPRMKKVLAYDDKGISKLEDVREHYNKSKAGGMFKYYDLEQYEQALKKAIYVPSEPFVDELPEDQSKRFDVLCHQYVFLKDPKLLDSISVQDGLKEYQFQPERLYPNVDLAETISLVCGKMIKQFKEEKVIFEDGEKVNLKNLDFYLIKNLIFWTQ